jgi:hypothetical protein
MTKSRNKNGPVPMNIDPPAGLRQAKDYLKYGQKMKERGRLQTRIGDLKKELIALKGLYDSVRARFDDCAYERRRLLDKLMAIEMSSASSTPYLSAASSLGSNKNIPVAKKAPPPPAPPAPPPSSVPYRTNKKAPASVPSAPPEPRGDPLIEELKARLKKRGGALYA